MINWLRNLFKIAPPVDFNELVRQGAVIVDVRTKAEYKSGHLSKSINIPLQELEQKLNLIPKNKTVITCCASGMRSSAARGILKSKGYEQVYNGGGWMSLQNKIG